MCYLPPPVFFRLCIKRTPSPMQHGKGSPYLPDDTNPVYQPDIFDFPILLAPRHIAGQGFETLRFLLFQHKLGSLHISRATPHKEFEHAGIPHTSAISQHIFQIGQRQMKYNRLGFALL